MPILEWLPNYRKQELSGDIFAGLTVGVMLIPQGMAYAMIAGLPPVYGLYASIVPQIIYAIFGTSRHLSVAPVAMDSLLVATGVTVLATEGTDAYIGFTVLLAFFMGIIQLFLGCLKLGFITNLLAKPVINGFTSAAAIIIGVSQLKYLLGVDLNKSNKVVEILHSTIMNLTSIHWVTLSMGILGIVIMKYVKKINPNIPGTLIVVVLGILSVYFLRLEDTGVQIVKTIPEGLPEFRLPDLSLGKFSELIPLALTLSVLAYMEAFGISKAMESKKRNYEVRPNQELIALGAANLIGSMFQSFPVTGGFSRSAVNEQSGANTPLASIISAGLISFTLMYLTPIFYYLPKVILASVIMVAVSGLVDMSYARKLWHENKLEFALFILTFLVTIHFSMVFGILSGIVFSIMILLYKEANPHIAKLGKVRGHHEFRNINRFEDLEVWEHVLILRLDASLTFINIQYFKEYIQNEITHAEGSIQTVILDAGPISYLDSTAVQGIRDLLIWFKEREVEFLISEVIGPVRDTFYQTGLIEYLNHNHIFIDLEEALRYATTAVGGEYEAYALQSNIRSVDMAFTTNPLSK